ncbi:hypothetical protein [Flavobacterium sp. Arc2]|uniref:hypothetical protein n=1 Tax=Flavobacterium sp. Arc2 TaxID=3046685 RepID=UPI00352C39D8
MELILFEKGYKVNNNIHNFMNFYYTINMKHLASDLLDKGLSPDQIANAFTAAIKVANASGIQVQKHFKPVYSAITREIIQDCKLSKLGYGLVLMNADSNLSTVGAFQIDVLKEYLNARR